MEVPNGIITLQLLRYQCTCKTKLYRFKLDYHPSHMHAEAKRKKGREGETKKKDKGRQRKAQRRIINNVPKNLLEPLPPILSHHPLFNNFHHTNVLIKGFSNKPYFPFMFYFSNLFFLLIHLFPSIPLFSFRILIYLFFSSSKYFVVDNAFFFLPHTF